MLRACAVGLLVSCGPSSGDDVPWASSSSSGASDGATTADTSSPGSSDASTTSSSGASASSSDDDDGDDDGPVCLLHHHETGIPGECQNDMGCCPGLKCVPSPDFSSCVPLDDSPAAIGEPCTAMGVQDDCVAGAVCRGVDVETGEGGRCVELCALGHSCDDPTTSCVESPHDLCLAPCDPLGAACPGTDACVPFEFAEIFACWPDTRPQIAGGFGDPCWDIDALLGCDPGAICLDDSLVQSTSCAGDLDDGCCTWLCDTDDPIACAMTETGICEPFDTAFAEAWPQLQVPTLGYCR